MRFTKQSDANLSLPADKPYLIRWDEALPGFGVRINPTNKVWVVSTVMGRVPVGGVAEVVIGGCRLGLGCEIHS